MAGETVITVVGNLTANPELRFTSSGQAVASFTIASTPRTYDRETGGWKDGEALFMRCSAWREMAENVAQSLTKGMRVIAQGRLNQRSYETQQGEKRTVVEMTVDEIGPSMRYATAQVNRNSRQGDFGGHDGGSQGYPNPGQNHDGNQGNQGGQGGFGEYGGGQNPGGYQGGQGAQGGQGGNQQGANPGGQNQPGGGYGGAPNQNGGYPGGADNGYGAFNQGNAGNAWGAPPAGGSSFDDEPPF